MSPKLIKILSLEDSDTDYLLLELYFQKMEKTGNLEIQAHQAHTVAEALTILDEQEVDFVFADLCVPDSLGISTVARLAAHGKGTPIVVISGMDKIDVDQKKLTDMGIIDFLNKTEVFKSSTAMEHNVCRLGPPGSSNRQEIPQQDLNKQKTSQGQTRNRSHHA